MVPSMLNNVPSSCQLRSRDHPEAVGEREDDQVPAPEQVAEWGGPHPYEGAVPDASLARETWRNRVLRACLLRPSGGWPSPFPGRV